MLKYPKEIKLEIINYKYRKNFVILKINGLKKEFNFAIPYALKINKNRNQLFLEYYYKIIYNKREYKEIQKLIYMKNLYYTLIKNIIIGSCKNYKIFFRLVDMNKDGYKVLIEKNKLILKLGYSHDIVYNILKNYEIKIGRKNKSFKLSYFDYQTITQLSFTIRKNRIPEPYKGKGILYKNEKIFRKKIRKLRSVKNFKKKRKIKKIK